MSALDKAALPLPDAPCPRAPSLAWRRFTL